MKKHWMPITFLTLVFCFTSLTFAKPPRFEGNEDIQYIREVMMQQKAQELAAVINLTAEQVETLNTLRANADNVKAQFEPQFEAAKLELETLAASVRANLENGAELTEADETALRTAKHELRTIGRAFKEAMRDAVGDLRGLFTLEQKIIIRDTLRPEPPEGDEFIENEALQHDRSFRRGDRGGHGRHPGKAGAKFAHLVLSDAFLEAVQ